MGTLISTWSLIPFLTEPLNYNHIQGPPPTPVNRHQIATSLGYSVFIPEIVYTCTHRSIFPRTPKFYTEKLIMFSLTVTSGVSMTPVHY